jgi:hypothetical protein
MDTNPSAATTMLVFVVPLKSRQVAISWHQVCLLLERTLRSICQQNSQRFRVIVVGNERPEINFTHPNIHYVTVDLPLPGVGHKKKDIDRAKKVLTGFYYARQFDPDYVMAVDADDCVHRDLAGFVVRSAECNGWYIDRGYVYEENRRFIYQRKSGFHRWCGSCYIVNYQRHPMPAAANDYRSSLLDYYREHREIVAQASRQGRSLASLPFSGVAYIVGNGENIYQKNFAMIHNANRGNWLFKLKDLRNFRYLTRSRAEKFGIAPLIGNPYQAT